MKKSKIVALLSLSVLAVAGVAGVATATNAGIFGGLAADAVVADGTCTLTYSAATAPTLVDGAGTKVVKHTEMAYKNAEKVSGAHVKLLANGEMYNSGKAYENGVGGMLNGFVSVKAVFMADTGATLHVKTSFDGKTYYDGGVLVSGQVYTRPSTQIAPRYVKLVAVGGAVTIKSASFNCTMEELYTDLAGKNCEYVGTVSIFDYVNAAEYTFPNTIIKVGADSVSFFDWTSMSPEKIYDLKLYPAGGDYYENFTTLVPDVNGEDAGHAYKYTIVDGKLTITSEGLVNNEYNIEVKQATKVVHNTKLDIKLDGKAVADKEVVTTTKGFENKFTVSTTYNTTDKITWTTASTNVTLVLSKDGKSAKVTFTAESGDAVIEVACGTVKKSFTVHVDAPVVSIAFPDALKGVTAKSDLCSFTFGEDGALTMASDLYESGLINEVWSALPAITKAGDVFTILYTSEGDATIEFSWNGTLLKIVSESTGNYDGTEFTIEGGGASTPSYPAVDFPTALENTKWTFADDAGLDLTLTFTDAGSVAVYEIGLYYATEDTLDSADFVAPLDTTVETVVIEYYDSTNPGCFGLKLVYNQKDNTLKLLTFTDSATETVNQHNVFGTIAQ